MRIFKPQDRVSVVKRYWQIRCSHRYGSLTPSQAGSRAELYGVIGLAEAWSTSMVVQTQLGRPEILRAPPRDGKDVGLNMADRPQVQDR